MTRSAGWWRAGAYQHLDEEGFTLIEVMISVVILTLVIGAITAALISVLSLSGSTTKSISDSADSQAVSANLTNDVQSAAEITTFASTKFGTPHDASCGTGTRLLGLQWNQVKGSTTFASDVSYLAVKRGNTWTLVRVECSAGSSIPASSETVSSDICQPAGSPTENGCLPDSTPSISEHHHRYTHTPKSGHKQGESGVDFIGRRDRGEVLIHGAGEQVHLHPGGKPHRRQPGKPGRRASHPRTRRAATEQPAPAPTRNSCAS